MDNIDLTQLDKRLQCELEKVSLLSCRKLIEIDIIELQKLCNFSVEDCECIKNIAATSLLPIGFQTAKQSEFIYKDKWRKLITNCQTIDAILGGGIPVRGITELSGESATGKTQLCLQLSINVQYPTEFGGFKASAIYICTEDPFPSLRIQQMLNNLDKDTLRKYNMENHNFSDYILIDHIGDLQSLHNCLFKRLPSYIENSQIKVGLIVIDSIAAIFRSEYSINEIINRANDLRMIAMQLHKLAYDYNIAVVCVNQVTDVCDNGMTIPALGLAWANLITTKLYLNVDDNNDNKLRKFHIIKAPHLPPACAHFSITQNGII